MVKKTAINNIASIITNDTMNVLFNAMKEESKIAFSPILSIIASILNIEGAKTIPPNTIGAKFMQYFTIIHLCLINPQLAKVENIIPLIKVRQFAGIIINKSM